MVRRLSQCKKSYCNECLEAIKWEKIMNIFIELQERFEYNQFQCNAATSTTLPILLIRIKSFDQLQMILQKYFSPQKETQLPALRCHQIVSELVLLPLFQNPAQQALQPWLQNQLPTENLKF